MVNNVLSFPFLFDNHNVLIYRGIVLLIIIGITAKFYKRHIAKCAKYRECIYGGKVDHNSQSSDLLKRWKEKYAKKA